MFAIIDIQGKQFNIQKNRWLLIPKLNQKMDYSFKIDKVLFFQDQSQTLIGNPVLNNVQVAAKVLEPVIKSKKIIVSKYKKRKGYHRKYGHRMVLTKILIEDILLK